MVTATTIRLISGKPVRSLFAGCCFLLMAFPAAAQIVDVTKPQQQYSTIYYNSETDSLPSFPGGSEKLFSFITEHFQVPVQHKSGRKQAILTIVACTVDTNGILTGIQFEKPADQTIPVPVETEQELIRVFGSMPAWSPGFKDGKKVISMVYVPIRFIVRDGRMEIYNTGPQYVAGSSKKNQTAKWLIIAGSLILFGVVILKLL